MDFILTLHGEIRWLVALVGVVAVVKFAIGWLGKKSYRRIDRQLMVIYTGLMDFNLLLGLLIILFLDGLNSARIEHASIMLLAIIIVHASAAWRKSKSNTKKFRNNLIVVLLSLGLVFMAVLRLRGAWMFS